MNSSLSIALVLIYEEVRKKIINKNIKTTEQVRLEIMQVAESLGFSLSNFEIELIENHIVSEKKKFGILQQYIEHDGINDIIIKSYNDISIQIGRRNIKTTTSFFSQQAYELFIEKILNNSGTQCTIKNPIVDFIVDNCRFNIVHSSLAAGGPYSTIRIKRYSNITINDLQKIQMLSAQIAKYLDGIVKIGRNILIIGEVGSGKTTLLRAMLENVPHDQSIIVIEDTPEIDLSHPHARYLRTRMSNNDGFGEIQIFDCIRASLRMAMNRLSLGEIRDPYAAQSFIDVSASGHAGISTLHADTVRDGINRLENLLARTEVGTSENAIKNMIGNSIDVAISVGFCPLAKKRKIKEIVEFCGVSDGNVKISLIFSYNSNIQKWRLEKRQSYFAEDLINYGIQISQFNDYDC